MKKILAVIFSIIISILCSACGSSNPTIEGEWYHIDTGHLYKFQDGHILCEDNYWEIRKGHKTTGLYEITKNNSYKAYIKDIRGYELKNDIYIVNYNGTKALSTTPDTSGRIIFLKSKNEVNKILDEQKRVEAEALKNIVLLYETKPSFNNHRLNKPLMSKDFSENNNHTAFLENDQFDLPKKWKADVFKDILGVYFIPDKEEPPIFSLVFLNTDNKLNLSNYLNRKALADSILNYYQNDLYKNILESVEIINCYVPERKILKSATTHIDINETDYLYIGCRGKIDGKNYFGIIKVRPYGEGISAFNLFQYIDSKYDFTNDMEAIFSTLKSTKYQKHKSPTTISEKEISSSGSTSDLDISYTKDYIDGNNMYLKVYVKNNSSAMFKGDVHVFFYTADGKKRLGSDMIIIDKLMPGQTNWAKVKIDKYLGSPKIETEFTNPQFLDVSPISTEIDNELSKKTTNSVRLNFDVASWYKNIESIKVMTDRTCIVTSTSSKDNSTIASAVWSCGKDHGVKSVQVVDSEGNIKAVYP